MPSGADLHTQPSGQENSHSAPTQTFDEIFEKFRLERLQDAARSASQARLGTLRVLVNGVTLKLALSADNDTLRQSLLQLATALLRLAEDLESRDLSLEGRIVTVESSSQKQAESLNNYAESLKSLRTTIDQRVKAAASQQADLAARVDQLERYTSIFVEHEAVEDPKKLLLRGVSEELREKLQRGDFEGLGTEGLEGTFVRAWQAEGGDGWNVVLAVSAVQRQKFVRAAKVIRTATRTVVAPYLTPKGRALRKERQSIFQRLKEQGLTPRWKGAEIEFFENGGWMKFGI